MVSKRNLPHWQLGGKTYFISFRCTAGELLPHERLCVIDRIRNGRNRFFVNHISVVMPDHVHLLITPLQERLDEYFPLSRIMKGIKGSSARDINRLRGSNGPIWQEESYDRIMRGHEEFDEKYQYVLLNPVRSGLCSEPSEYPFFLLPEHWSEAPLPELK